MENQLKIIEKCLDKDDNLSKYNAVKNELDAIHDHIKEGIHIRSKCEWYEHSEKSTKFFLNLEKQRGAQNTIKKLIVEDKEIIDQTHILEYIREFCETLFKKRKQKTAAEIKNFLRQFNIQKLPEDKSKLCEEDLTEKDLYDSLQSKSPGNDGLTKDFYETCWNQLKEIFVDSVLEANEKGHLNLSQRQAIIKSIEKKDRDKRFIKNWRLISLLNVDLKIISKVLLLNEKTGQFFSRNGY